MDSSCSLLGATDVTLESNPDPNPESRTPESSVEWPTFLGDLTVLAREAFDFEETFESLSFSFLEDDLLKELLEFGLDSSSLPSCILDIRVGIPFPCCENSVSGGLGGRPSLVDREVEKCSVDLNLSFSSAPTSVDSGVYGLVDFEDNLTSSLLLSASLLCALLKDGYGRLLLDDAPGAEAVRESSGTRSAIDDDASEALDPPPLSLSFFRREDFITSPVVGSINFGRELREDLCGRFGSLSLFDRCFLSVDLSSSLVSSSI